MAIFVGLIGLLIGIGMIKYSKRIVEWIWPKSVGVVEKPLLSFKDKGQKLKDSSHLSEQKAATIWIIRIFGVIWSAVSMLFIFFGIFGK